MPYTEIGYGREALYSGLADEAKLDLHDRHRALSTKHAVVSVGVTWAEILKILGDNIIAANPELKNREWNFKLHVRNNGVRVEFFDDVGFRRAEAEAVAARMK